MDDQEEQEFYFAVDVEGEEEASGPLIITEELKFCEMIEVEDVHFNHDSAVLLPIQYERTGPLPMRNALEEIACCYLYAMQNPSKLMLIAGHTDKSGKPWYNDWLSEKRAENVLNIMLGQRKDWVDSVCDSSKKPPRPLQKYPEGKSKVEDYQMILKWVDDKYRWLCDPGAVEDGWPAREGDTKKAIEVFQENYNKELRAQVGGKSIAVDGFMGSETWGAFFDVYMLELAELLGLDSDVSRLETYRNALKFVDDRKIVGGGETHARSRFERSLEDRRVHILFFDPKEKPKLDFMDKRDCHEGIGDKILGDPAHYKKAKKKADECELYGTPEIYRKDPITCDLDHTLIIEVLDHKGNHKSSVPVIVQDEGKPPTAPPFKKGPTNANGIYIVPKVPEGVYSVYVDTQKREDLKRFKGVEEQVEIKK